MCRSETWRPASAAASTSSSPSRSRERDRLAARAAATPRGRRRSAGSRRAGPARCDAQLALVRPHAVERLAQELDQLRVDDARLVVAAAVADRRPRELLGRAARARAPPPSRTRPARRVAGAGERLAEREQQLGPVRRVGRLAQPLGLQRALELARLVLPGERLRRPVGRLARVADRRAPAPPSGAPGRSGGPARPRRGAARRGCASSVSAIAPCSRTRRASLRARRTASRGSARARTKPAGRGRRSSRAARRRPRGRARRRRSPRAGPRPRAARRRERLPGDGREREHLGSRARRAAPRAARPPRSRPPGHQLVERPPGSAIGEHAQHLLEEQRVAAGQLAQLRRGPASPRHPVRPDERLGLVAVEPLRARSRSSGSSRRRSAIRPASGEDGLHLARRDTRRHEQPLRHRGARARCRSSRSVGPVGPVQVVEQTARACRVPASGRASPSSPRRAGSARLPAARSARARRSTDSWRRSSGTSRPSSSSSSRSPPPKPSTCPCAKQCPIISTNGW